MPDGGTDHICTYNFILNIFSQFTHVESHSSTVSLLESGE